MEFTLTFIRIFIVDLYLAAPLVLFFCLLIIVLGQIVGHIEGWSRFDAAYWSFITALTVGYGDIRPFKRISKELAIVIALTGIMFTGVLVALTVHSAAKAFEKHVARQTIMKLEEKIKL
jgi:voltage-gated potassium channel Kch